MSDSSDDEAIDYDNDDPISDESEDEVLASEDDEDDDDDDEFENDDRFSRFKIELKKDEMASDLEDDNDEDENSEISNSQAWGKDKKSYYRTDYVDKDFRGQKQKDEDLAKYEEEEAVQIQKRLLDSINEEDLGIDLLIDDGISSKTSTKESIKKKTDEDSAMSLNELSESQKISLIKQDSPELESLIGDFRKYFTEIKDKFESAMVGTNSNSSSELLKLKLLILINYCSNITFYLAMKCSSERKMVKDHPIIKRLFIYKKLMKECSGKLLNPQIDANLNQSNDQSYDNDNNDDDDEEILGDDEKRSITYQMQKNKGLTPKRKREQRNPRVKYRKKFEKAVVRRKGQVRLPRKELKKYPGEVTGINTRAIKSIKFK